MSSHPVSCKLERAITGPGEGLAIARDLLLEGAAFGAFQPYTQRLTFGLRHGLPCHGKNRPLETVNRLLEGGEMLSHLRFFAHYHCPPMSRLIRRGVLTFLLIFLPIRV